MEQPEYCSANTENTRNFRDHVIVIHHDNHKTLILPLFKSSEGNVFEIYEVYSIIYNKQSVSLTMVFRERKGIKCLSVVPIQGESHHFWDFYNWLVDEFGLRKV
jgi:hypothetical protein